MHIRSSGTRWALVCLSTLLAMSAVAQSTKKLSTVKKFQVALSSTISTANFQPQIDPNVGIEHDEAAENDRTPMPAREAANVLKAGKLGTFARGVPKAYFPGPTDGRYVPPDCNMAVGPNHIAVVINATLGIYSKTGTLQFQQTLENFFGSTAETGFVFDPKAFYDPISNRYFLIALDLDTGAQISNALIAVSDDNNPNGNWFKYRIPTKLTNGGNNYWLDYPGFGFNKDAIALSGNMFGFTSGYFGVQALVIRKSDLLTGGTAQISQLLEPGGGTLQLARTTDAATDKIFGMARGGGNAIRLYAITNITTTPVLNVVNVPVPAYNGPAGPAPSTNGNTLDTLDGRIFNAQYRGGHIVGAHNISNGGVNTARWYDVNANTWPASGNPSLTQSGDINVPGATSHMPAINMNGLNDISVVFTRSSTTIAADLMYAARAVTDPLGQLGTPNILTTSSGSYGGGRWGDYFSCEVDPSDDSTFWAFGMAINNGGYKTEIKSWTVSTGGTGTQVNADTISTIKGTFIGGDVTSLTTSDDVNYQIASVADAALGQAAGAEITYTVPTTSTSVSLNLEVTATAAGGTTMIYGFNWNTNQYVLIKSIPTPGSGNAQSLVAIPSATLQTYLNGTGQMKFMVRSHIPKRPFSSAFPPPFTYKIDLAQLLVR